MNRVLLVGRIDNVDFRRNVAAGQWAKEAGHITLEVKELFEFEWTQWLAMNKVKYQLWTDDINHMVAINDDADNDYQCFETFCESKYKYEEPELNFEEIAKTARLQRMRESKREYCFISFAVDGAPMEQQLVLEVFSDLAPKTAENFAALCKKGYRQTQVHRIVPNGWIQMGDTSSDSKGDGGHSSFEERYFADETFAVSHSGRGMLGMANCGPHTNQSQFYVTLEAKPFLDKKFVCFGTVIEGTTVLDQLEKAETFNERPTRPITIIDCGVFNDHLV